jgi:hypothetical protein
MEDIEKNQILDQKMQEEKVKDLIHKVVMDLLKDKSVKYGSIDQAIDFSKFYKVLEYNKGVKWINVEIGDVVIGNYLIKSIKSFLSNRGDFVYKTKYNNDEKIIKIKAFYVYEKKDKNLEINFKYLELLELI